MYLNPGDVPDSFDFYTKEGFSLAGYFKSGDEENIRLSKLIK